MNIKEMFESQVSKIGDGCWDWQKSMTHDGYGRFCLFRKTLLAHRFSYMLYRGDIPEGMFVLHKCDNPACSNPDHLFLGTQQDNMDDMVAKGRHKKPLNYRGENHQNTTLTDLKVREIREMSKDGVFQKAIAKNFGIKQATVSSIITGRTWSHVK